MSIHMDSRIGLMGVNGAGKSTFLNMMMGNLREKEGHVRREKKLRVGYFTQHHMELVDQGPKSYPISVLNTLFPGEKEQVYRQHLALFGIRGKLAMQLVNTMSGGQKSRLAFSILTWNHPHILVLDEPTNHLDTETIDALVGAIAGFKGGVITVSHDQHFLEQACKELWVLKKGKCKQFGGTFKDYKKLETKKFAKSRVVKGRRGNQRR